MDNLNKLGTFAIKANQEMLHNLRDIDAGIEEIVRVLFQFEGEIPQDVWVALDLMQTKLDKSVKQCMLFPGYVHRISPNTFEKRNVHAES